MGGSGSEPTLCDATKHFPEHQIHSSKGQRRGQRYMAADGSKSLVNQGEIHVTHVDPKDGKFDFTFQHAPGVHCPIVSVRHLCDVGCTVVFNGKHGVIKYKDGRKLKFVLKDGVYFIAMNVLPPGVPITVISKTDPPTEGFTGRGHA